MIGVWGGGCVGRAVPNEMAVATSWPYPLPERVAALRSSLYLHLVDLANHWQVRLGLDGRFASVNSAFLERFHGREQRVWPSTSIFAAISIAS